MSLRTTSITAPIPDRPLNMNDRDHHHAKARRVQVWRDAAFWWAKQHKLRTRSTKPVEMWVEFGVTDPGRRRDPHNWYPTIKAVCDGFTTAAVWPDDSSEYVKTYEPTFTDAVADRHLRITLTWEQE